MASVRLQQVEKVYPAAETPALKRMDLEIPDGELFVLLGPSGCGKSTLLKLIAGIEEPTDGAVWIGDRVVNFMPPGQRDVAMVFQNYALYPHMSVEQNIRFPLRMERSRRAGADGAVRRVTELLGLEELVRRSVSQLSGGQKQRVAVARALVREPAVLLMDEPLSNLDALLRAQLREELIALHDQLGGTVVYVTHDQVEAMTMADRIGVMHAGAMVQLGTPREIYSQPANRFVAGFIGSPPMNFVEGELRRAGERLAFSADGLVAEVPADLAARLGEGVPGVAVTLGVRPEDVRLVVDARPGDDTAWTVHIVENLGREQIVSVRRGEALVRVRAAPEVRLERGDAVTLSIDAGGLYLFAADGRNMAVGDLQPAHAPRSSDTAAAGV